MHRRARILFPALVLLGGALVAPEALAFCRSTTCTGDCPRDEDGCKTTGQKLAWPGGCVGFSLQQDGSANLSIAAIRPAIKASFLTWTDVGCPIGTASLSFAELEDVACRKSEYNSGGLNANVIMFQDTEWNYHSMDNTLAKTTVSFDTETGEINDADIEVNFAYNEFTVSDSKVVYDLQSVLTHEIGHFIGLDHSPFTDATMFASYDPGTIELRTLADDDVEAICTVYLPERQAACDPSPKNGLANECQSKAAAAPGTGGGCSLGGGGGASNVGFLSGALLLSMLFLRRRS